LHVFSCSCEFALLVRDIKVVAAFFCQLRHSAISFDDLIRSPPDLRSPYKPMLVVRYPRSLKIVFGIRLSSNFCLERLTVHENFDKRDNL
jgi:hypothetical protein